MKPITATNSGGSNYEPVAAGTYVARCYSMVHIGTISEVVMGEKKELNKVRITWELPTEMKVFSEERGEQPHAISKEFTLSMHEKATLRKFLESWRGKGFTDKEAESFDITKLLGVPCMISIIHKTSKTSGKTYADVASVSTMPKGLHCPEQVNKTFVFSHEEYDEEAFNSLPDFLKDKIKSSKEYKSMQEPNTTEAPSSVSDDEDDLPF